MTTDSLPPARRQPEVLDFLLTRRSRPARTLGLPVPTRAELMTILTAAARVPDHGKLEPWRFVVLGRPALVRLAGQATETGRRLGLADDQIAKGVSQFADSNLAILVVKRPKSTEKIPEIEQILSTGAVCVSLLNAAQAAGFGANLLTGWAIADEAFRRDALGLDAGEWVAGVIHIGTETSVPPERPRPDMDGLIIWVDA